MTQLQDIPEIWQYYNTVGQRDDGTIIPPSDGPMLTLTDWEQFGETAGC